MSAWVRGRLEVFCLSSFCTDMACFLFHPRVITLSALTSSRSRFCPNLIPKCALARAIVTKADSRLQTSRWLDPIVSVRTRKLSSKASGGSRILKILKFLCLTTGLVFWISIGLSIAFYGTGRLKVHRNQQLAPVYNAALFEVDAKIFAYWQKQGGSAMKEVIEEMRVKHLALGAVWEKLWNDGAFQRRFGQNVSISGYKVLITDDKERSSDRWKVCLYIDGSNSSGLVTVVFHKANTDNIKWIPVSLLIETLPNSGVKICDISAPLPNGITKFTRLFNDD